MSNHQRRFPEKIQAMLKKGALSGVLAAMACSHAPAPQLKEAGDKVSVAHRGASAYSPENTLEAYRLAIEQGADYVEQDLQISSDGVLVCLHDITLERTTDVAEVFPDRYREVEQDGQSVRRWFVFDFTVDEIQRLDAGSWFSESYAGARIPTLGAAIQEIRGKAGIFPELKHPEEYTARGFDMEKLFLEELGRRGLDRRDSDPQTPVIVQSFSEASLRKLALDLNSDLPLVLLLGRPDPNILSPEGLRQVSQYASGIGPNKQLLLDEPQIVRWAREAGLTVTPYTFRSALIGPGFETVADEMSHFLYTLEVDALFTDNPDLFPRSP
ncbi:MAG TPA: glycerophosphodiester phosphodiesterase family protein [Acidobacteriota bacterium]|nr:glycerophosphodiester phosphodiesterase family protein [Acidobacteriota bacterium]